jgi:hypothetical protein
MISEKFLRLLDKYIPANQTLKRSLPKKSDSNKDDNSKYEGEEWKNTLITNLGGYKHPVIINGKDCQIADAKDVYVYVDFVKAGRHFYTVNYQDNFYLNRAIVRQREEPVVSFNKRLMFTKKPYKFEDSVFGACKEDTCEGMYEHDASLWKLSNFIKKQDRLTELLHYLQSKYLHIV